MTRTLAAVSPCAAVLPFGHATARAADMPGNTSAEATVAPTGEPRAGTFEGAADAAWYRAELRARRTYAARIDTDACATVEPRDAEGGLLAASPRTSDQGVVGWTYAPRASGRHLIAVRRCDPDGAVQRAADRGRHGPPRRDPGSRAARALPVSGGGPRPAVPPGVRTRRRCHPRGSTVHTGRIPALLAVAPAVARGEDLPGDPKAGPTVAERRCSSCHRIGAGEATPPDARAPSFRAVADAEGVGPTAVHVWLHSPHETMPHIRLQEKEAEDAAAYISGLRAAESR